MADKKAVVFALNKLQVSHLTVAFTHAINLESDDRDWINESEIKNIVATVSTPFHLILRSQSPPKRAKARHSAQGIVDSLAKRCNIALARLGGSLRARREAAICFVAHV